MGERRGGGRSGGVPDGRGEGKGQEQKASSDSISWCPWHPSFSKQFFFLKKQEKNLLFNGRK